MSTHLFARGKQIATGAVLAGLAAAVLLPASAAHAAATFSVSLSPTSTSVHTGVAQLYTATARDASGAGVAGVGLTVDVVTKAISATNPLSSNGLSAPTAGGISGSWTLSGAVTTGTTGSATFSVNASAVGGISLQVYAGGAPYTAGQPSATSFLTVLGPTADDIAMMSAGPVTDTQAVGAGQTISVSMVDAAGVPLPGVTPAASIIGANPFSVITCTAGNTAGASVCTYANPNVGTDSVRVWINKSTGTGPFYEAGEVFASVTRSTVAPAPVVTVPANLTVLTKSAKRGAVVTYVASGSDALDGALPVVCDHPSGSVFATGTTTVTCGATNSHGVSAAASFAVTVLVRTSGH